MRRLSAVMAVVAASGCVCGTPCRVDGDCVGAVCDVSLGVCVERDGGSGRGGGSGGGSTTAGGGAGGGTGTSGGAGGGNGGGSSLSCAGMTCAPWEECTPTGDGGRCGDAQLSIQWLTPADQTVIGGGQAITSNIRVTKLDGGAVPSSVVLVPVRGLDTADSLNFAKSGGTFPGMLGPVTGTDGPKRFVAGWDAGPTALVTLQLDTTGPVLDVQLINAPSYGSDGGFLGMDPGETGSVVKKDETVTLRVTSAAMDIAPATLALSVTVAVDAGLDVWDAGAPSSCGAAAFCREFALALGPQPLRDFAAGVNVTASARDAVGNDGGVVRAGLFRATRWKWARLAVPNSNAIRGAPAVGPGGDVYMPSANAGTMAGVFRVTPTGAVTQDTNAGPTEGGIAIGFDGTSHHVFFLTTNGGLRVLGTGENCGVMSTTNASSPAVLDDGQAGMHGVGVVGDTGTRVLLGARPGQGCVGLIASPASVSSAVAPGNVVIDGQSVWYPATGGLIKHFTRAATVFSAQPDITGIAAGTIYGLSIFSNGTRLGGGGGAGVGRLFVRPSDGSGVTTGYNMMAHVTGVAVGSSSNLFAITEDTTMPGMGTERGTLRRFDATGNTIAASANLPATFAFPFLEGTIPGSTTPVLGMNGWVYATANNGNLVAADQLTLSIKWLKALPSPVTGAVVASPTLDCNRTGSGSTGVYYFATSAGWLVGYIVDSPGLDTSAAWPKYQHDARNTGNTAASLACP